MDAQEICRCIALAFLGSSLSVAAEYAVESALDALLAVLRPFGIVKRIMPEVRVKVNSFRLQSVWAVGLSHFPLFLLVAAFRSQLAASAVLRPPDPLRTWLTALLLMVLCDAWFFWTHSAMHRHRRLYRLAHAEHHRITADLGPFGTAHAGALEFLLDWVAFHVLLVAALLRLRQWFPLELLLALLPMGLVNALGHCAHHVPLWLRGALSLGMQCLPFAQTPVTHLLHHVDPRFNRALYFTWWDQWMGTACSDTRLLQREGK